MGNMRISHRTIFLLWSVPLALIVLIFLKPEIPASVGVMTYFGIWVLLFGACIVFAKRWSVSGASGRPLDVFEIPVYLSAIWVGLISIFGLAPYFDDKYLVGTLSSPSDLPVGLGLIGIGIISLWVGYLMGRFLFKPTYKPWRLSTSKLYFQNPSLFLTISIYVCLLFLRLSLLTRGLGEGTNKITSIGSFQQWINYLVEMRWFFIALILLQVFCGKWRRGYLVLMLLFEVLIAVISGWAATIILLSLLTFGCWMYSGARGNLGKMIMGGAVVFFLALVTVPLARNMRNAELISAESVSSNLAKTVDTYWLSRTQNSFVYAWNLLVTRQSGIAQTPAIIKRLTPSLIPYRPLTELVLSPLSFIPRALWPSKPSYSALLQPLVTIDYRGGGAKIGSSAVTMFGNLYMYGGWLVVVTGMFVLGVVSALMYAKLAAPAISSGQMALLAVYLAVVIATFSIAERDYIGIWQGLIQRTVLYSILALLICSRVRKGSFY